MADHWQLVQQHGGVRCRFDRRLLGPRPHRQRRRYSRRSAHGRHPGVRGYVRKPWLDAFDRFRRSFDAQYDDRQSSCHGQQPDRHAEPRGGRHEGTHQERGRNPGARRNQYLHGRTHGQRRDGQPPARRLQQRAADELRRDHQQRWHGRSRQHQRHEQRDRLHGECRWNPQPDLLSCSRAFSHPQWRRGDRQRQREIQWRGFRPGWQRHRWRHNGLQHRDCKRHRFWKPHLHGGRFHHEPGRRPHDQRQRGHQGNRNPHQGRWWHDGGRYSQYLLGRNQHQCRNLPRHQQFRLGHRDRGGHGGGQWNPRRKRHGVRCSQHQRRAISRGE